MGSQADFQPRSEHLLILAMAVIAIVCSFILQLGEAGMPALPIPGTGTWVRLPGMCASRRILGISCPGCGLTRSFVALSHGEVRRAFRFNAMGPVIYLICLLQIPYRVTEYVGIGRSSIRWSRIKSRFDLVIWLVLIGLFAQWGVRILWGY